MEGRRIFAAIDVSDEVRAAAAAYMSQLRQEFSHLRVGWERPEKLHITINFAGYLDEAQLADYIAMAVKAATASSPFLITAAGTGAFIKRRGTNVLWLGLEADEFTRIAVAFDDISNGPAPRRSFNPHLTIARLREPQNSKALIDLHISANFGPFVFTAHEIVIYESTLLPSGSVYKALSRHPFAA